MRATEACEINPPLSRRDLGAFAARSCEGLSVGYDMVCTAPLVPTGAAMEYRGMDLVYTTYEYIELQL